MAFTPEQIDALLGLSNFPGFTYDPTKQDTLIGQLDPFLGTPQQTGRMRAYCYINIEGTDVTDKFFPHLISVHVTAGQPTSAAEIELDDRDGTLPLPPIGASVIVVLGWETEEGVVVFNGWIQDLEHGFGRKQGGRRMWIHAQGTDFLEGKTKTPIQDDMGQGAPPGKKEGELHGLDDWLKQLAGHAGVQATINAALGKFKADYWNIANASPMHEMENLSKQFNFRYMFTGQGAGRKSVLIQMPGEYGLSCMAIWRDNLIGWRLKPFNARSAFMGATQQFYDATMAALKITKQTFGQTAAPFDQVAGMLQPQAPAATETGAKNSTQGAQQDADSSAFGNGRIMINGEPKAQWNSLVILVGARPGVDGMYEIKVVEHVYSRQGFITNLEVIPQGGALAGDYSAWRTWLPKAQPNVGGQSAVR